MVDDEELLLQLIAADLESHGAVVELAESLKEAMEILASHDFDFIISDLRMPGGSGIDLLSEVKTTRHKNVPFLFMTGNTDQPAAALQAEGAIGVLYKPFAFEDLVKILETNVPGKPTKLS